jgi:hypothetical protein
MNNSPSVQAMLATKKNRVHGVYVSAAQLLKEVRALPSNEREKFVCALLEGEQTASSVTAGRNKRVKWPDVEARARRIFGRRVFPNLVLLERTEQNG